MGYASMLEDIRDRIADGLENIAEDFISIEEKYRSTHMPFSMVDQLNELKEIYKQCMSLLDEINQLLEIATSPDLDSAHELALLQIQLPYLQARSERLGQETEKRISAEKRVQELELELFKRMQRKHYIKGTPEKRQKKLAKHA